jgi:hypothetical protein
MSPLSPRRLAFALASASLALPTSAIAAAAPNTYEQISRASGAAGATKLDADTKPVPLLASDTGIWAAYNPSGQGELLIEPALPATSLRNTVTNHTRTFGAGRGQIVSADRFERTAIFQRVIKVDDSTYVRKYAVGRIDGTDALRDLDVSDRATVRLSGDGRFVLSADQQGLRRLSLSTGVWTTLSQVGIIGRWAVSDDGRTVAGISYDLTAGRLDAVVWRGNTPTTIVKGYNYAGPGTEPAVSPDGSTVFTTVLGGDSPAPTVVTARRLSDGRITTTNAPFEKAYAARPIWLSPSGDRIAFALNYQDPSSGPLESAKVWAVGSGWSKFGGAFATSLVNDGSPAVPSAISRNGRYAALAYNDQVALVSLTGNPLAGNAAGADALSATSYVNTPGLNSCGFGFSSTVSGSFTTPAFWAPAPRSARIAIGNGTQTLEQADWTKPLPYPNAGNVDADFISVSFPLGTPHTRTLDLSVVDGAGRTVTERLSATVTCGQTAN